MPTNNRENLKLKDAVYLCVREREETDTGRKTQPEKYKKKLIDKKKTAPLAGPHPCAPTQITKHTAEPTHQKYVLEKCECASL